MMKVLLLPVVLCCAGSAGLAQGARSPLLLYADGVVGGGSGFGGGVCIRAEVFRNHELSLGYQLFINRSGNLPADYRTGSIVGKGQYPQDVLKGVTIGYGRVLPLAASKGGALWRVSLRGSLLLGIRSEPGNFVRHPNIFGDLYTYDKISRPAAGVVIQPGVILSPEELFGVSAGTFGVFGKDFAAFGVYGSFMLGRVTTRQGRFPRRVFN